MKIQIIFFFLFKAQNCILLWSGTSLMVLDPCWYELIAGFFIRNRHTVACFAHPPTWTHTRTQTAFQYLTQKCPRAHTQLFEISWLYKHCSTIYLRRHRQTFAAGCEKLFSCNGTCFPKCWSCSKMRKSTTPKDKERKHRLRDLHIPIDILSCFWHNSAIL